MKFNKTFKVVTENEYFPDRAMKELEKYSFDGTICFSESPVFTMDVKNLVILSEENDLDDLYVMKETGKLEKVEDIIRHFQVSTLQLGIDFNLQDFFDKNKNAKCIVFYLTGSNSIFHEGYTVRTAVLTEGHLNQDGSKDFTTSEPYDSLNPSPAKYISDTQIYP